jgi:hypothetical protein
VKTTIEISAVLLARAKRHALRSGGSLRALVEDGLRRVLEVEQTRPGYKLPDCSVGRAGGPNPLETLSWQDLRDHIYGRR